MRCVGCGITTSNPKAENWKLWQMCYGCAKSAHPDHYKDKPDHGTGGSRMHMKIVTNSMIAQPTKHANTAEE